MENAANDLHDSKLQVQNAALDKTNLEHLKQEAAGLRHAMEHGLAEKAHLSQIINELQLDFNKVKVENEILLEAVKPEVSSGLYHSYANDWVGL